jgi:hypothetical protein
MKSVEKPDQISVKTLRMMDASMKNFAKGIAGDPVDIEELRKIFGHREASSSDRRSHITIKSQKECVYVSSKSV